MNTANVIGKPEWYIGIQLYILAINTKYHAQPPPGLNISFDFSSTYIFMIN